MTKNLTPMETLAFFKSVILSGEAWSPTCQEAFDGAKAALAPKKNLLDDAGVVEAAIRRSLVDMRVDDAKIKEIVAALRAVPEKKENLSGTDFLSMDQVREMGGGK